MVVGEGWVQCGVKLYPYGDGGRVLLLVPVLSLFLLRKILLVVDWGRAAVNSDCRVNGRYMGDFLARTQKNLKSPSPGSAYLIPKIGSPSPGWASNGLK